MICFLPAITGFTQSIRLPEGVTMDTLSGGYAPGLYRYHLYRNKGVIAAISPLDWTNADTPVRDKLPVYEAEFYMGSVRKDSFATAEEALRWLLPQIDTYYSPVHYLKWQSLRVQPPKALLRFPFEWTYRLDRQANIFQSKSPTTNRLVLLSPSRSEIVQVIRTPNTGKLTLNQLIQLSKRMNPAIDLGRNPLQDATIGGKAFKHTTHLFMELMLQEHYWYADQKEIIYIGVALLREDQVRFPLAVKEILQSIKW